MVLVKPAVGATTVLSRVWRLAATLRRVELDNGAPCGDILPFVQFSDKRWTLCIDCVLLAQVYITPVISIFSSSNLGCFETVEWVSGRATVVVVVVIITLRIRSFQIRCILLRIFSFVRQSRHSLLTH